MKKKNIVLIFMIFVLSVVFIVDIAYFLKRDNDRLVELIKPTYIVSELSNIEKEVVSDDMQFYQVNNSTIGDSYNDIYAFSSTRSFFWFHNEYGYLEKEDSVCHFISGSWKIEDNKLVLYDQSLYCYKNPIWEYNEVSGRWFPSSNDIVITGITSEEKNIVISDDKSIVIDDNIWYPIDMSEAIMNKFKEWPLFKNKSDIIFSLNY